MCVDLITWGYRSEDTWAVRSEDGALKVIVASFEIGTVYGDE